ncbi:MAG TPA: TonB-dependent receptor [Hyphomonadaceae bacterium]|nr:TonB-dependent receptor [Hyphomonadaceae bacterium]
MKNIKSRLITTAALAMLAGAMIAPASAQEPAGAQQGDGEIDTIYVVAQRRSEDLQEVPIAATAVSAERISDLLSGGGDVLSLAGRAPGLNVESSNGRVAPRFYIRGLGNTDFDLAASQPVSVVIDDVVQENVALKSFPIFDVEQVEVLRGPQGTLYGRNTPAGIVHFRSVRPNEEFDANVSASYGSFGTAVLDGAVGGAMADGVSARGSLSFRRRDDWVDNSFNNTELGSYEDLAGRVQVLIEPSDAFSALLNVHGRSYEGTSTLFRANVLSTGSNDLNSNFDREKVWYDGGGGNEQEYDQFGGSATLSFDVGGLTLTSISAYETLDGRSRGDIDGGVCEPLGSPVPAGLTSGTTDCFFPFPDPPVDDAVTYPGRLLFASDTQDSIDDLTQFTQEIRLASDEGAFNWQAGVFYFDSDLTVSTVGVGFPPLATLNHTNTSWAVFGQAGFDVSDQLSVSAGVRYTDDEKDLRGVITPGPVSVSVSDEQVSWDLSAVYAMSDDANLYARIASGFRAPTIQGRDVAFFNPPSVATSETIQSYEAGFKSDLFDRRARLNGAVFYYEITDQQFSAIGGLGNFNQLINADKGEGYGFELEGELAVTDALTLTSAFSYNHTEIKDATLAVGTCGSGQCTVRDPLNLAGNALIDGNPFPQAPEFIFDFTARYEHPLSSGATLFAATDWMVRGEFNIFLYDAVEYQTDRQFEGGLRAGYRSADGRWEAAVFGRNITDEENVIGGIDFNNNTAFVNEPRVVGVSLSARMN